MIPASDSAQTVPGTPQRVLVRRYAGLPRVLVVPQAIVVSRSRSLEATLDERLDPRRTAVLEEGSPLRAGWDPADGTVRLLARAPGRAKLEVTIPGEGILVVFDTFQSGWRAAVDGRPARVVPADAAFQGIRLPQGKHVVELHYRPPGLAAGIAAAAVGVLGLVFCAVRLPRS